MADPKLVIVRRGHFATFELLTRAFADDPGVKVIWDRRASERPDAQTVPTPEVERRRGASKQWGQLDYILAAHPDDSTKTAGSC